MASIIQVGNKFRAQVRRKGLPTLTRTWPTEQEARDWATLEESKIISGEKIGVQGKVGVLLADAIDRYLKEKKDMGKTGVDILGYLKKGLGKKVIDQLTDDDIVTYIEEKNFSPTSGAMHFSFLCTVLKMAKVGWKYHVPEILEEARDRLKILGLTGKSKERDRRPTHDEIKLLLEFKYSQSVPMGDIIRFAISSAMRQAEITRIERHTLKQAQSVDEQATIIITDRKHPTKKKGNHQIVPLLEESLEIINRQTKKPGDDRIFPYDPKAIGIIFWRACKQLGIKDLHFHDLRHEAASRLFEMGYKIQEVAMFTGHEDWKMLQRYTHLKAKDIRTMKTKPAVQLAAAAMDVAPQGSNAVVMDAATMEQFKMFQTMQAMMAQQKAA